MRDRTNIPETIRISDYNLRKKSNFSGVVEGRSGNPYLVLEDGKLREFDSLFECAYHYDRSTRNISYVRKKKIKFNHSGKTIQILGTDTRMGGKK